MRQLLLIVFMSVLMTMRPVEVASIISVPVVHQGFASIAGKHDLIFVPVGIATGSGNVIYHILEELYDFPMHYQFVGSCELERVQHEAIMLDSNVIFRCGKASMQGTVISYGKKLNIVDDSMNLLKVSLVGIVGLFVYRILMQAL